MRLVWGTVTAVLTERSGIQRLDVRLDDSDVQVALAYPSLGGRCAAGDRVLVNTTARDLALGTGGADLVVTRIQGGSAPEGVAFEDASPGHIMKMRYTPLQRDVLAVEEPESAYHDVLRDADELAGMPVVCCSLHSQVALVAAALKETRPESVVAYVLTDEATLALAMSESVSRCREAGLIDVSVTCGQAFGGDLEAVNVYSGLLATRLVAAADVAVVAIGPGVAGTGTRLGHGGVSQGIVANAAASLGGRPIVVLRVSEADGRDRHQGVSHHSLTVLSRITLAPCLVPVPDFGSELGPSIDATLQESGVWERHERVDVPRTRGELPDVRGVPASTMGRGPEDDPAFFVAAAAAGDVAAGMGES